MTIPAGIRVIPGYVVRVSAGRYDAPDGYFGCVYIIVNALITKVHKPCDLDLTGMGIIPAATIH